MSKSVTTMYTYIHMRYFSLAKKITMPRNRSILLEIRKLFSAKFEFIRRREERSLIQRILLNYDFLKNADVRIYSTPYTVFDVRLI